MLGKRPNAVEYPDGQKRQRTSQEMFGSKHTMDLKEMQALKDNLKNYQSAGLPKIEKSKLEKIPEKVEITKFEIEMPPKLGFIKEAGKDEEISEISKKSEMNLSFKPKTDYSYSDQKKSSEGAPPIIKSELKSEPKLESYSSKSIKKVEVISSFTDFKPPNTKHCYQKIYEKFRYSLMNLEKLTIATKNQAHKKNLDNITKSGLKQL